MRTLGLADPAFLGGMGGGVAYDTDAAAYITAVETADGQALETAVADAINAFVVGCKADGIWDAIKASCILAGARTLNGALVPLVGAAPTRFGTEAGWNYIRATGLKGNGTNNYLNGNRNNSADPQNNRHIAVYATVLPDFSIINGIAGFANPLNGSTGLVGYSNLFEVRLSGSSQSTVTKPSVPGVLGASRFNSSEIVIRSGQGSSVLSNASQTPASGDLPIFKRDAYYSGATRLAFYSIGEALDLALLDARVTTLINAFAAVIP